MPKVWESILLRGTRPIRHRYHVWKLRKIIGHGYDTGVSAGKHFQSPRRRYEQDQEKGAVDGSCALMPVLIPRSERLCAEGHRMLFRTALMPGLENVVILGCDDGECAHSVFTRLREFAVAYGLRVAPTG